MNERLSSRDIQAIRRGFETVSARGWGLALGLLAGLGLFAATAMLVIKGGPPVGPHLGLLGIYFPGYEVSWAGAFIGAGYAFVLGTGVGFAVGAIYNLVVDRSA